MKKKLEEATLGNVLRLFSKRIDDFTGESRRGYRKAYSSFQLFTVGNYSTSTMLDSSIIGNWVVENILQGLSNKTINFYLEKISSLYTRIAGRLIGGKEDIFKEVKKKLKILPDYKYKEEIERVQKKIKSFVTKREVFGQRIRIIEELEHLPENNKLHLPERIRYIWGCLALKAGVLPNIVKGIVGTPPPGLQLLDICETPVISTSEFKEACAKITENLKDKELKWYAMRLRPKVKFESLMERFSILSPMVKMPEIFYPCDEIARRIGRKMVWAGKPVIRDVVFFKSFKEDIYPLFTNLYDLAWCYRTPGKGSDNYASIPEKAMEDFKKALGFLNPDFEVSQAGELELSPGDQVVIVDGEYAMEMAEIIKRQPEAERGKKIYRVSLLNKNGHWDIGIDVRLLKKA